jgi:hypothetical protein
MKKTLIILFFGIFLISSTCQKEEKDCHYHIAIKNNSIDTIISAILIPGGDGKFSMDGHEIEPGGVDEYRPYNSCIENSIGDELIALFIINPEQFNYPNERYDCDSAEFNNDIQEKFLLSLNYLKEKNFEIIYSSEK